MKVPFIFFAIVSTLIGAAALYVGIQHNAMGEFCRDDNLDVCKFDYLYAAGIWASWFVVSFVILSIIGYLARLLIRKSRHRSEL